MSLGRSAFFSLVCCSATLVAQEQAVPVATTPAPVPEPVVFVVDCSQSMNELVVGLDPPTRRFDLVMQQLQLQWTRLSQVPGARVGVIMLGHRVGWNTQAPGQMLLQAAYARQIPPELRPYEDVEVIRKLDAFTPESLQELLAVTATVRPWGETPLYLAVREALREFKPTETGRVIVVTDGVNNVFNPPPDKIVTMLDVVQQVAAGPIPVHLVGFQFAPNEPAAGIVEYRELAARTGGSFVQAGTSATLLDALNLAMTVAARPIVATPAVQVLPAPAVVPVPVAPTAIPVAPARPVVPVVPVPVTPATPATVVPAVPVAPAAAVVPAVPVVPVAPPVKVVVPPVKVVVP